MQKAFINCWPTLPAINRGTLMLSIQDLAADNDETLRFTWIAGKEGRTRHIQDSAANTSAADLLGHLNVVHPSRIQVFGKEELIFYNRISAVQREKILIELAEGGVPAMILAEGWILPPTWLAFAPAAEYPCYRLR